METTENKFSWMKNSIGVKISIIGFIILLMLIPSGLIKDLMRERRGRNNEVFREVTSKWGETQKIKGLVLTVPCIETSGLKNKKIYTKKKFHILPDKLLISGEIIPKKLHRGIFSVLVYNARLHFDGYFDSISIPKAEYKNITFLWGNATLSLGINDTKGINKNVIVTWDGQETETSPGIKNCEVIKKGVYMPVEINPTKKHTFSFDVDINGSDLLSLYPLGKETKVDLRSTWQHPQFDGAFLPKTRTVNNNGFEASWSILQHNRSFPQMWLGGENLENSAFGVELIEPVDIYQKSMRAVKYSMLFIILTFLVFLFSELIISKKAHPIQYIMVGASLCLFFSLLIALSEHLHFNLAYLIASLIIIILITLFSKGVFENIRVSSIIFGILIILFTFLFVILQLMDYSLIIGNIGLVIALAIIMIVSKKIDWYKEK